MRWIIRTGPFGHDHDSVSRDDDVIRNKQFEHEERSPSLLKQTHTQMNRLGLDKSTIDMGQTLEPLLLSV